MQKTIYIANQALWDSIKAATNGKSISRYLVDLHLDNVAQVRAAEIRADRSVVESLAHPGHRSKFDRSTPGGGSQTPPPPTPGGSPDGQPNSQ